MALASATVRTATLARSRGGCGLAPTSEHALPPPLGRACSLHARGTARLPAAAAAHTLRSAVGRREVATRAFRGLFGGGKEDKAEQDAEDALSPPFKLMATKEGYEVRLYDTYFYVSTNYDRRDEGIATVTSYFEGKNAAEVNVPATQPVIMRYVPLGGGEFNKAMSLYVPKAGDAPPPMPTVPGMTMQVSGAELVAVLRFSGNITPETSAAAVEQLTAALAADGITPKEVDTGAFRMAQYGQLYQLAARKNELWLQLNASDAAKFMT